MIPILFIFGACSGSFVYCTAWRLSFPTNQTSWWRGRSNCDNCQRQLTWWQLIPIAGWLIQKGRCHFCRQPVSWHSTAFELLCGIFSASYLSSLNPPDYLLWLVFMILAFNCLTDWWRRLVYWPPLLLTGMLGAIQRLKNFEFRNPNIWIALTFLSLILALIYFRGGLGLGDFDLLLYWLCFFTLQTVLLATVIGCILALVHNYKQTTSYQIPFVPYLCVGLATALFYFSI